MANPPFNIKEWWDGKMEGDARWKYGTPPQTAMRESAPLKSDGTPQVVSEARDKMPESGGKRFFAHIKDFGRGQRRPQPAPVGER